MSVIHAASRPPTLGDGHCAWRWHWEDVTLYCREPVIPGLQVCAEHFIEHAQDRADAGIPPATPTAVKAEAAARGKAT